MKKWAIMLLVLLVVGGGAYYYFYHHRSDVQSGNGYQTTVISRGDIENTITATGTLSAIGTVNVGAQVSGTLTTVEVDFNDRVAAGQVLARLDTALFDASVRDAQAGKAKAVALLHKAQAEFKRNKSLFEKGFISETEYLSYETDLETAEAGVQSADAALHRARINLDYAIVRAPIDGTIIERSVDAGQTIASSLQAPQLFIIAEDLSKMQIEVDVDESDIGLITEGLAVRFEVQAFPDRSFTGIVRQIRLQPTTISNVVTYTVVVDSSNEDRVLLPGMTATVDFLLDQKKDVLLVPNSALTLKPSTEMMELMRARRAVRGDSHGGAGGGMGMGGEGGGFNYSEAGRLFVLQEDGSPRVALVETGVTDGVNTEIVRILRGDEDLEGVPVITGFSKNQEEQKKSGISMPFGPPPQARGMRRSGL
ncbi:efflux RND transporter periplasmic adaptor subunit [bacterium]|nr:efflux RND transporter periplasmic adaptor subunit [candidate division CSSED10-310 bacterium]